MTLIKEELKNILNYSDIFPSDCQDIINYVERLENNWNKLKEWLQERKFVYNITGEDLDEDTSITEVLDKMQEIESRK